jgi:hypothetical protein
LPLLALYKDHQLTLINDLKELGLV